MAAAPAETAEDALLASCREAEPLVNLSLYAECLGSFPHDATLPALALRDQARAGLIGDELIPLLAIATVDAPNLAAFLHLAKALAAFGSRARSASPILVERLDGIQVTTDRRFWALDGGLWALAHTGGDVATRFLDKLAGEKPSRVMRSKSVYRGDLTDDERERIHHETLSRCRAQAAQDSAGWTTKLTTLEPHIDDDTTKSTALKPWMTR